MTTTLSANGLIEIPEVFRKADALKPGQRCEIERLGHGEYRLRVGDAVVPAEPRERLSEVLRSCPVKDFFKPMERSETTDDLKPLSFE
jgi:bifunctional DNA-binding transcriptional regulator/antitoxin component of YhaV-PrlF toxin-antitoxin module